jgi:16S rRNA U516 pseudouridylate synthase RsuA-like enzyme
VRVKIGALGIGTLPIGKWRVLTPAEIASFGIGTRPKGYRR